MNPITVTLCRIDDIESAPNIDALVSEYGAESSIAGIGQVRPNFDMYREMEANGVLHSIGAYRGNELVGFINLLIYVVAHYSALTAATESFFVAKSARKYGAGLLLLNEAESLARELGAVGILVSAPNGGKLAEVLSRHRAYEETNRVFFRGFV